MTDSEMERHIVMPSQTIGYGSPLRSIVQSTRVMQFDTEIDTENQYRQVESDTYAITPSYLLVELIPMEHTARLVRIIALWR